MPRSSDVLRSGTSRPATVQQEGVCFTVSGMLRLRHVLKPVFALTLLSQGTSAAGLFALQFRKDVSPDYYAVGIPVGYASLAAIVLGVLYNFAIGRPGYDHWARWKLTSAAFSIAVAAVTAFPLAHQFRSDGIKLPVLLALFAIGGALLGSAGVDSVQRACLGKPNLLAGISLLPNVTFLLALAVPANPDIAWLIPAFAWSVGALLQALASTFLVRTNLPETAPPQNRPHIHSEASSRLQFIGLSAGAATSAIFPGLFSSAIVSLASGTAAALFLASRIVTSAVSLGLNSILLTRINWHREAPNFTRPATTTVCLGTAALLIALAIPGEAGRSSLAATGLVLLLVAQTLISREVNFHAKGVVILCKSLVDLGGSAVAVVLLTQNPSGAGYFSAYCLSQAITTLICGVGLGARVLAVVSSAGVAGSLALIALS